MDSFIAIDRSFIISIFPPSVPAELFGPSHGMSGYNCISDAIVFLLIGRYIDFKAAGRCLSGRIGNRWVNDIAQNSSWELKQL
ncbi:MAG: hypothetical protein CL677_09875 [Bdellovibrionaceae bacterium]|nr:hypothetical protein [Pseudobdellovibrionaceae bacterium]